MWGRRFRTCMLTVTPTPTDALAPAATVLHVERDGDRTVVGALRTMLPLGLREVRGPDDGWARVAIVQTAAMLVGGDDVRLTVVVGTGARLHLTDISATLAHPGTRARQRIDLRVEAGGRLVFAEQPLIVAAGADLDRHVRLTLGPGAAALHHDTLVLGRHDEEPGDARLRLRVEQADMAVVDEALATGDIGVLRSAAVLGDAGAVGSLGLYGAAPPGPLPADAFVLGALHTLVRRPASSTRSLTALDALREAWATAL